MWFLDNFYKYTVGIILILLIILLLYYTAPVFYPVLWFVAAILLPILFSTLLYYIFRPIVSLLERWMPRYLAIIAVYFVVAIVTVVVLLVIIPEITDLIASITPENIETFKGNMTHFFASLKNTVVFSNLKAFETALSEYLPKINAFVYQLVVNLISTLASIAIGIVLTPFVLFYFLRDDHLFSKALLRFVPLHYQDEVQKTVHDIDNTLSEFILAQLTIAGIIGVFLLCGYFLIGLPHALPLALFAMIFYVIPILGTFIAIIPALIIGMTISLSMTLKVILVMYIAHFLEANLLTPRLMSLRLKIHPLTVILLLLAAGSLYGLLGLLLVTPTYAILKVIVWNLYKISRLHYAAAKQNANQE